MTEPASEAGARPLGILGRALRPVDGASLAAFRILFGGLMVFGVVRFVAAGWVHDFYVEPTYFFKFRGFEWVEVWSPTGLYLHFAGIGAAALAILLGYRTRLAFAVFTLLFAYVELMDVVPYLNHYLLVGWLGLLGVFLPTERVWSLDARRGRREGRPTTSTVPAVAVWLLRFQIGVVYFYAALAKAGEDWLIHAQPLGIWLQKRTEIPVLGELFAVPGAPYVMSWGGFLYDLSIVGWLLWPRSRPFAYLAVIAFHLVTAALFQIGLFPWLMIIATTVFFRPEWPRRALGSLGRLSGRAWAAAARVEPAVAPPGVAGWRLRWGVAAVGLYALFHVAVPLRHFAYPGDVLWTEEGMRAAWKVMVREKSGSVTFRVTRKSDGRTWYVAPGEYLTPRQEAEMSSQPDLIHQLARHIRWESLRRGRGDVEVRVDAVVSLNGRPAAPMIDPDVDLAAVAPSFSAASWILPAPSTSPLPVRVAWRKGR